MNWPSWAALLSISTLPFAIMDVFRKILRTLEIQSQHVFLRLYTLKSKTVIMERIEHDILSVSKSVVLYQQYLHVTACLATGCIYTEPGGSTRMLYTAPGKVKAGDQEYQVRNIAACPLYL